MAERLERTFKSRYRIESHRPSSHRIKNWSISSDSVGVAVQFEEPLSSITLSVVALVYGGLHLVAWNAPFNTRIEGILLKISGISVASIGPVSIVYTGWHCGLAPYLRSHRFNESTRLLIRFENITTWMGLLLTTGYLLLYLFARVYLVVECFIEVAYLPESAFTTPVFTRYIPHLG